MDSKNKKLSSFLSSASRRLQARRVALGSQRSGRVGQTTYVKYGFEVSRIIKCDDLDALDRFFGFEDDDDLGLEDGCVRGVLGRQKQDLAAAVSFVLADLSTARPIPAASRTEFQPPRPVRGLEITLAPRLLPIPAARSCHVN